MTKRKPFRRVLFITALLTALAAVGVLYPGSAPAFARQTPTPQASPQPSPPAAAAQAVTSPAQRDARSAAATPEEDGAASPQSTRAEARKPQNWDYWVVGGILLVLSILFYLLISYSSRLENSNYLGTVFRDTVEETEFRSLAGPYREKWADFGYHKHAERDPEVQRRIKEAESGRHRPAQAQAAGTGSGEETLHIVGTGSGSYVVGTGTGSGYHEEVERQARKNYNADLDKARERAKDRAGRVVGGIDLNAIRGRGPEFVLEFTAVVVLVFAVVILGLLHVLESQPIATLLAAIAGYVLGRASTRKQGAEGARGTAEVVELIRAVSALTQPNGKPPPPRPPKEGPGPGGPPSGLTEGQPAGSAGPGVEPDAAASG